MVFGILFLIFVGSYWIIRYIVHSYKGATYEYETRTAQQEKNDRRETWLSSAVNTDLEQHLRYAIGVADQSVVSELRKLASAYPDDMVFQIALLIEQKPSGKTTSRDAALLILMSQHGKLPNEYARYGILALGDYETSDGVKLRTQQITFLRHIEAELHRHGLPGATLQLFPPNGIPRSAESTTPFPTARFTFCAPAMHNYKG